MCECVSLSYWLDGEEQSREAGGALARALSPMVHSRAAVVFVRGDLGAGKSTLVRGFLSALGVSGVMPSPTYTLVEPYEIDNLTIYHMDAYRLADSAELDFLGLDEMHQAGSITLVEWPDHVRDAFPNPAVTVSLEMSQEPLDDLDQRQPQSHISSDLLADNDSAACGKIGRALTLDMSGLSDNARRQLLADDAWSGFKRVLT